VEEVAMSAIVHGIIGGAIATALAAASLATQRPVEADRSGWKRLRPNWYIHFALIGCILFVAAISFFFLSGGSARRDAEEQNFYAFLLMVAFGAGGFWTLCAGYLRRVEWQGETIRIRFFGSEHRFHFADFVEVRDGLDGSELKFLTADGRVFRVSQYFHGSKQLFRALFESFERRTLADWSHRER
jgi:hypothetical protein